MKRNLLLSLFFIVYCQFVKSQENTNSSDDKTVTLTVAGQGKTIDEAKTNALRSAIEQAFGTFISSKTEILNDNVVKDEIVSVANGNIQKFEILNQTTLPDGVSFTTLKATVSVNKLISFCKSKGVKVEFKGSLFAFNIIMQELNEKSELVAWQNMKGLLESLLKSSITYQIDAKQPQLYGEKYKIPISINVTMNDNYKKVMNLLLEFCKNVSLSTTDVDQCKQLNKTFYPIIFTTTSESAASIIGELTSRKCVTNGIITFNLRNKTVANEVLMTPWNLARQSIYGMTISNGINKISISDDMEVDVKTTSNGSRGFIVANNPCGKGGAMYGIHFWSLFGLSELGGRQRNQENIRNVYHIKGSLDYQPEIFNGDFYEPFYRQDNLPIVLFCEIKEFLRLEFNDIRSLDEIKNITEYKIEQNK